MAGKKTRLDLALVELGFAETTQRATALIMAGQVLVSDKLVTHAGFAVADTSLIRLKDADHTYVSRGALKLEKGLDSFHIDVRDTIALDVGASTGGFTDLLLRRGAKQVFAIDVGYGQLAWSLRQDPRVVVLERQNIRDLDPALITTRTDLAVIDVSFISLIAVLPKVVELLGPGKTIVALVKPQFEVAKELVEKGGVVRDDKVRWSAVDKIKDWAQRAGLEAGDAIDSPITGPAGNREFLLRLTT